MDIAAKLQSRIAVTPTEFVETMHLMETRYGAKDFIPVSSKSTLRPMTYYITQVDNLYRRSYDRYLTKADKVEANGVHGLAH